MSPLLNKDLKEMDDRRKRQLLKDPAPSSLQPNGTVASRPVDFLPNHSLTSTRIIEQLSSSHDLAKMLADFRAKGGRIRQREVCDPFCATGSNSTAAGVNGHSRTTEASGVKHPVKADSEEEKPNRLNEMTWAPKVSCRNFFSF